PPAHSPRATAATPQGVHPKIPARPNKRDGLCPLATLEAALASADVLVMLVDHNEFKAVSGDSVTQAFIVDTKGVWR
ncbi:UDP binding domain-containing protein, partial [Klebsiella pneumoniae]|uniref:UDP binding domain-containing protein n=1 Tax=Klebsiella pneumoniae TaxID=573 RepID=UPI003F631CD8